MAMLEGRVAICTGAEVAKAMAKHGASVVVNDPGVGSAAEGADTAPAAPVVAEIEAAGGKQSPTMDRLQASKITLR
jgi:NAD(P)-dependent dehydrogenase (short-subunit alcohol dehydrogenase family)